MTPRPRGLEAVLRRENTERQRADEGVKPWNAAVACGNCGLRLIPLSYPLPPSQDAGGEERPDLNCYGCGQHHRWNVRRGWVLAESRVQRQG
jgi:hypothetical protein